MAGRSQLSSQAQINAVLRYAPQRQALAQAAQEARSEHAAAIAGAQSDARLNQANVTNAVPAVQGVYNRAEGTTSAARQQLASVLSGLGPAASNFQAAAATEGAQGAEKTARERAGEEASLRSQSLATAAAPAFARTLADQHLAASLAKIFSTAQGVAGQEGLATSTEQAREDKEARQAALTERGQNLTSQSAKEGHSLTAQGLSQKAAEHQENLAAGQYSKAGGKGKPNLLPVSQLAAAASTLREIEHEARGLKEQGQGRNAILSELTTAHPTSNTVKTDEKGQPIKNAKGELQYEKVPALKAHDTLLAEAALDSVYGYGRVSKATLEKLHNAGYSIKALQLQGPGPPKAAKPAPPGERTLKAIAGLF